MASKRSRASRVVSPSASDDFKLIKGIGLAVERRLHKAGIHNFAQLAALSADQIAARVVGLSAKRITHENWSGQARRLARPSTHKPARKKAAKEKPSKPRTSATPRMGRQHYATFTVEMLLDENNDVRRTRCAHVQSGDQETWAGWEEARLVGFVVEHAGLRLSRAPAPIPATQPQAAPSAIVTAHPIPPPVLETGPTPAHALEVQASPREQGAEQETRPSEAETLSREAAQGKMARRAETSQGKAASARFARSDLERRAQGDRGGLSGVPRLIELVTMPADSDQPRKLLPAGARFRVRFSMDLTDVKELPDVPLDLVTSVYVKGMGGGMRQLIGQARDVVKLTDKVMVQIECQELPPGLYRLEAEVALSLPSTGPQAPRGLTTLLRGSLLQIY